VAWKIAKIPEAKGEIDKYLATIDNPTIAAAAIVELRGHLDRIVENPKIGSAPNGPFEPRHVYQFQLRAAGRCYAHIAYRVADDGEILVLGFSYSAKAE